MNEVIAKKLIKKETIKDFCQKNGIIYLGVFGSSLRKGKRQTGDIDILVKFDSPKGLEFITIRDGLKKLLRKKVDLVTEGALHHLLKDKILKEVVPVYEKG